MAEMILPEDMQPQPELTADEVLEFILSRLVPFAISVDWATECHNLFVAEKNNLGLAPRGARSGDIVAVLYGCKSPVVLRPIEDHFEIIGDAYIHYFMNGEAIELAQKEELEERVFILH